MGFEDVDIEIFAEQANGRTNAVSLIQKRIRELERGWPRLVNTEEMDIIQVAIEEFREGRIWLVGGEEADSLREQRVIEERDRARQIEAARRAAELDAGTSPTVPRAPGLSGVLGFKS